MDSYATKTLLFLLHNNPAGVAFNAEPLLLLSCRGYGRMENATIIVYEWETIQRGHSPIGNAEQMVLCMVMIGVTIM